MHTNMDCSEFKEIAEWQAITIGDQTYDVPYDWQGHALMLGPKILETNDTSGLCNTPEIINLDGFGRRVARILTNPNKSRRFIIGTEVYFYCLDWKYLFPDKSRIVIHAEFCGGKKPQDEAYEICSLERGPRVSGYVINIICLKLKEKGIKHDAEFWKQDIWFFTRSIANELSVPGTKKSDFELRTGDRPRWVNHEE